MAKYVVHHIESSEDYRNWSSFYGNKKDAVADYESTVVEFEADKQNEDFKYAMCELKKVTSTGYELIKHWDDVDGWVEL